jgi:hypothetical protein
LSFFFTFGDQVPPAIIIFRKVSLPKSIPFMLYSFSAIKVGPKLSNSGPFMNFLTSCNTISLVCDYLDDRTVLRPNRQDLLGDIFAGSVSRAAG